MHITRSNNNCNSPAHEASVTFAGSGQSAGSPGRSVAKETKRLTKVEFMTTTVKVLMENGKSGFAALIDQHRRAVAPLAALSIVLVLCDRRLQ